MLDIKIAIICNYVDMFIKIKIGSAAEDERVAIPAM